MRPNLVKEGQRAGLTLEDVPHEIAQRGLHLRLDLRGQAKTGERLDVEALVGLEHLERVQA